MSSLIPFGEPGRNIGPVQSWQLSRRERKLEVELAETMQDQVKREYKQQLKHASHLAELQRTQERANAGITVTSHVYDTAVAATAGDPGKAAFLLPIVERAASKCAGLVDG